MFQGRCPVELKDNALAALGRLRGGISVLCELLSRFPSASFALSELDVEEVRLLFQECRTAADEVSVAVDLLCGIMLAISDTDETLGVCESDLEMPKSVYEFSEWLQKCSELGDMAAHMADPAAKNTADEASRHRIQADLMSARMLRGFNSADPISQMPGNACALEEHGYVEVVVSSGRFSLPKEWSQGVGCLVGFASIWFPILRLAPIDNYAQLLRDGLDDLDDEGWGCVEHPDMSERRFIIAEAAEAIALPADYFLAAQIPGEGEALCHVDCAGGCFEIWKPEVLDTALEEVDLPLLF